MKKPIFFMLVLVFFGISACFAQDVHGDHHEGMMVEQQETTGEGEKELIDVDNKICPVHGREIEEDTKVTYEHEGKIYNFCCAMCVDGFEKDPQKYIQILEKTEQDEI